MAKRKSFLIRMPPELLDAWRRVAEGELRSLNAQIEHELREGLRRLGIRLAQRGAGDATPLESDAVDPEPSA